MNCHRARQLISPFLDQQLTGREMLVLQQHFSECASCEAERRSIRQVKMLLRALHEPRPRPDLPSVISVRLTEAEQPLWRGLTLTVTPSWPPRPQRGRRLITALALSCLTVLSFAAACFAPASRDGMLTSSGFLLQTGLTPAQPMLGNEPGPALLTAAPPSDFLGMTEADALRHGRLFVGQEEPTTASELRLSAFPYEPSPGYGQPSYGQIKTTFAAYRSR